jgi:hypothetical protein
MMSRISDVARKGYQMAPQYRVRRPEIYDIDNGLPTLSRFVQLLSSMKNKIA